MSNSKRQRTKKSNKLIRGRSKTRVAVVVLVVCLVGVSSVAAPWVRNLATKTAPTFLAPAPPSPPPSQPAKEYIYAGNKLIATEEPPISLSPPAGLSANTLSDVTPSQILINWSATAGATHYEVERSRNVSTNYTVIANNVTGTTFSDTTVTSVNAYLYRVRAVSSGGATSPYSNLDVATAISFTGDTLAPGSTTIKRDHITELRLAVNAVRATTANLGPASWAEVITAGSTMVQASHITELRTKLDEARSALNLPACSYTSIAIGDLIQKIHFEQLRQCVK
jgi:hypothetical protein